MKSRALVASLTGLLGSVAAGCGDDAPTGPLPLVADPAVVTGCTARPAVGVVRAKVVACEAELVGGRLATGRIGDFVLENDRVRVIVRGQGEGYFLHGSYGGGIIDAAITGGEDLVKELVPVVDLAAGAFDELVITEAGDDGPAELVVRGPATALDLVAGTLGTPPPPIIIEHHYRLAANADQLELSTRVFAQPGSAATTHELFDGMFLGARAPWFVPGEGPGGSGPAEIIATGGTTTSYALVAPPRTSALRRIGIDSLTVIRGSALADAPATRWLVLGDGSVASVTEKAWRLRGTPLGVLSGQTAPGVAVMVRTGTAPITIARADGDGRYRVALPAGAYTVHAEAPGRAIGADVAASVVADTEVTAAIPAGAGGTLSLTVDDDRGLGLPARVMLEQPGDRRMTWTDGAGRATIGLPPGTWRVTVSRGLEYDAFVAAAVTIDDRVTTALPVTLERVVDTAGWIALDTHLHSEMSSDSTFPVDDRLRAVAGEGIEVPVSSDHDIATDYTPVIAALGLDRWLGTLPGAEVSSVVWGHLNGFPQTIDPRRAGGGAARWVGRAPGAVFAAMRAGGAELVQVNHPRRSSANLFDAIDLDPVTLTARRDPTLLDLPAGTDLSDLGFDAVEVANGGSAEDFEQVFADWLAMTAAGHPAAATGSSDSHGATAIAGSARTYVWVGAGADDPATVDTDRIVDAIKARRVVVGTGSFVTAGIVTAAGTSGPGDTVDVTGLAAVKLRVRVQAPPWQPLAAIRVYQGRAMIRMIVLDPAQTEPVRFDAEIEVPTPTADTSYVVRVDPAGPGAPVLGDTMPSFTNPLFATVSP